MALINAKVDAPHGSHHPSKFGGHRHCGSGYIMLLMCDVSS